MFKRLPQKKQDEQCPAFKRSKKGDGTKTAKAGAKRGMYHFFNLFDQNVVKSIDKYVNQAHVVSSWLNIWYSVLSQIIRCK